jgi:hypothetical protein
VTRKVAESRLGDMTRSLYLVRPSRLRIVVGRDSGMYSKDDRRVRARFDLCGHSYCVVVTDPVIQREYLAGSDGESELEDTVICVSLGEVYGGFAYKLAAAVITPQRAGE